MHIQDCDRFLNDLIKNNLVFIFCIQNNLVQNLNEMEWNDEIKIKELTLR